MTVQSALNILQSAVDHCRVDDIRTPGIYGALTFLEGHSAVKEPFDNFRSAMQFPGMTNRHKEALLSILKRRDERDPPLRGWYKIRIRVALGVRPMGNEASAHCLERPSGRVVGIKSP